MIGKTLLVAGGLLTSVGFGVALGAYVVPEYRTEQPAPVPDPVATYPLPLEPEAFGKFECFLDNGTKLTIDDHAEGMTFYAGNGGTMHLLRNDDLTDNRLHVAAVGTGSKSISVTLSREGEATVTLVNAEGDGAVQVVDADCRPVN